MAEAKEINQILGQNIKAVRNNFNITRENLAEKINVSPRFLADVERGKVGVSLSTLKNICEFLNVSADYLLGISKSDSNELYINSIESKIKNMSTNKLKNLNCIIDCIINMDFEK